MNTVLRACVAIGLLIGSAAWGEAQLPEYNRFKRVAELAGIKPE